MKKMVVKDDRDWTIEDMIENVLTGRKPMIEVDDRKEKEKQK